MTDWECRRLRPRSFGFAAVFLIAFAGGVSAQPMPLPERIAQCGGCHGEDGNSKIENIPSLAGQPAFFVLNQLVLMREGVRVVEAMTPFVKELKDDEINALAAHYDKLPPKLSDEKIDPALAKQGEGLAVKLRCASCHLPSLAGQEQMPRLAKQRIDYLVHSMKQFRDGTRSGADTTMSNVVAGASDADIAALAHFAAGK